MKLDTLPEDNVLGILACLPVSSVLRVRQTCKTLAAIAQAPSLWALLLARLAKLGTPIPSLPHKTHCNVSQTLLCSESEILVRHAVLLSKNWTSAYPRPTRSLGFSFHPTFDQEPETPSLTANATPTTFSAVTGPQISTSVTLGAESDTEAELPPSSSSAPVPVPVPSLSLSPTPDPPRPTPRLLSPVDLDFLPGWSGRLLLTSQITVLDGDVPGASQRMWQIQVWDLSDLYDSGAVTGTGTGAKGRCIASLHIRARGGMAIDKCSATAVEKKTGSHVKRVRLAIFERSDDGVDDKLNIYELVPRLSPRQGYSPRPVDAKEKGKGKEIRNTGGTWTDEGFVESTKQVYGMGGGFNLVASYPGFYVPLLFDGSTLVTRDDNERITLFHLFDADEVAQPYADALPLSEPPLTSSDAKVPVPAMLLPYCHLQDENDTVQPKTCMTVHLGSSCIIDFRQRSITVYPLPAPPTAPPPMPAMSSPHITGSGPGSALSSSLAWRDSQMPTLAPLATHRFQWRLYDITVHERPTGSRDLADSDSEGTNSTVPLLDLFLRFDSYLPWPVNMLHHLVLMPSSHSTHETDATSPIHHLEHPFSDSPYDPIPKQHGAWPSHVALFARADMVVGAHGTALWLDSETGALDGHELEAAVGTGCLIGMGAGMGIGSGGGETTQRVAGRRLYEVGRDDDNDEGVYEEQDTSASPGEPAVHTQLQEEAAQPHSLAPEAEAENEDTAPQDDSDEENDGDGLPNLLPLELEMTATVTATPAAEHPTEGEGEGPISTFAVRDSSASVSRPTSDSADIERGGADRRGSPMAMGKEDWVRIALCEEEGLVAIMGANGGVEVRGYGPIE